MIIHTSLHGSTPSPLHGDTKVPTDNWIPGDWARPMRRTVAEDKMDMSNSCCLDVWTYHVKLVNVNNECDIEGEKIRFFLKKKIPALERQKQKDCKLRICHSYTGDLKSAPAT